MTKLWSKVSMLGLAMLLTLPGSVLDAEHVAWQIGQHDRDYAEFAVAGDWNAYSARFSDDPVFVVGKDDPARAWPYIHPAPADAWAGNREHPFEIRFELDGATPAYYRLRLHFVSTHGSVPPLLNIRINEQAWDIRTQSGAGDTALTQAEEGRPQTYSVIMSADVLKPTENRLVITAKEGSWVLYDAIELVGFDNLSEIKGLTAEVQPYLYHSDEGDSRLVRLRLQQGMLTEPATITVGCGGRKVERTIDPAGKLLDQVDVFFPVATAAEPVIAAVQLKTGEQELETEVKIAPQRKWEIHLVHQTHLDIGYTHTQEDVLQRQMEHLRLALKTIEASSSRPPAERFRWHPEGMWAVDEFMRTAGAEEKQALVAAAKARDIHMDCMYAQAMTGMYNEEELFELMGSAKRFERQHGVPILSAMQTDVPGYTWGLTTALAHHGVHYLSLGPNGGHRIGRTRTWGDRPFYWVTPDGKDKVLFWMTSGPYSWGIGSSTERGFDSAEVERFLNSLEQKGYPYDIVMIRYGLGGDNGPPNPILPKIVKEWNAKHAYPKFIISRNSDVLKEMERRHGDQLPVVSGDFTPYWEDGCASTSADTAVNRRACERIVQAQNLWSMLKPDAQLHDRFFAAWEKLIMYDEHTWGAHNSISAPDSEFAIRQVLYKQKFALDGARMTDELVRDIVSDRHRSGSNTVDVYNTVNWARSQLVILSKQQSVAGDLVADSRGQPIASQRLSTGELAFVAKDVPAFGGRRYTLRRGAANPQGKAHAEGLRLSNDIVGVELDPRTGAITNFRHNDLPGNLADTGSEKATGLNDYLYHLGRDEKRGFSGVQDTTVTVEDAGPLVATLRIESTAPGCKSLTRRIRVVDGSDRVEIVNTTDKSKERRPEGVYFSYPFNIPNAVSRIDIPWAVAQVEKDQIEGANRNYYCVQRWVDLSNDDYGVTWVTLDAPMLQFDPIKIAEAWGLQYWRTLIEPQPFIHSWVINNHWETNYKADQEGLITFRYVLAPHTGGYEPVRAQRVAREMHQPLIPVTVDPAQPLPQPPVQVAGDGIIVTTLRPSQDGKALMVRLFNVADGSRPATLKWSRPIATTWISNPMEEQIRRAPERLELAKFEVVTLRMER